ATRIAAFCEICSMTDGSRSATQFRALGCQSLTKMRQSALYRRCGKDSDMSPRKRWLAASRSLPVDPEVWQRLLNISDQECWSNRVTPKSWPERSSPQVMIPDGARKSARRPENAESKNSRVLR